MSGAATLVAEPSHPRASPRFIRALRISAAPASESRAQPSYTVSACAGTGLVFLSSSRLHRSLLPDPAAVRSMFAGIAGRYDLANRVLSGGVDRSWRRKVMAAAGSPGPGSTVVDVACGTGDLALLFARAGARVVGVDFTYEMVALAPSKERRSGGEMAWLQGDGLELPLGDSVADAATIAFGLRNVADRRRCIQELARVVRPGGSVLVLEFSMPRKDAFGRVYRAYLEHVLPRIGGALSGDRAAYDYLDDTVQGWPGPEQLQAEMEQDGLVDCSFDRLWRGIACIHRGVVPLTAPARGQAGA